MRAASLRRLAIPPVTTVSVGPVRRVISGHLLRETHYAKLLFRILVNINIRD